MTTKHQVCALRTSTAGLTTFVPVHTWPIAPMQLVTNTVICVKRICLFGVNHTNSSTMMQSITASLQQFRLSDASGIADKAITKLIDNLSRNRNGIVRLKLFKRNGHEFEAALLVEPTKCSNCSNMIWLPHGQRCKLCKLISHMKCLNMIENTCCKSTCIASTSSQEHLHKLSSVRMKFDAPTFCDHCGTCIIFLCSYSKCSLCLRNFHQDCLKLIPQECQPRQANGQAIVQRYNKTSLLTIKHFDVLALLGSGSFSKVYLARRNTGDRKGELFAIKAIKKTNPVVNGDPSSVFNEWQSLQLGRSYPFLTVAHCCFQSQERLYFVMDYVQGKDLLYYVNEEGALSENRVRFHAAEIVLALIYMHKNDIVYRDLKLNNVILDQYGHCKLIDFGMSKRLQVQHQMKTKTFCGTVFYISPEILRAAEYSFSVDWWSLGVLMYEMLCDNLPFNGENDDEIFSAIVSKEVTYPNHIKISDRAKSIIEGLLEKDPSKRLGCDLMEGCVAAIKQHPFFVHDNKADPISSDWWRDIEALRIRPPYIPRKLGGDGSFRSSHLNLTPVNFDQVNELTQSHFEGFSQYSKSFFGADEFDRINS